MNRCQGKPGLFEFSREQESMLNRAALQFATLRRINPAYDLDGGIRNWIRNHPMGKGVSVRDIKDRMPQD